jgi:hypothetical protein
MLAMRWRHEEELKTHICDKDGVNKAIPTKQQVRETSRTEKCNLPRREEPGEAEGESYYSIPSLDVG